MSGMQRTNRSVWLETSPATVYPALGDRLRVDVAVVGGGITGLTTALLLKQRGCRVAVLERHRVATGTTGFSTAKVSSLHGLTYARLLREQGEHKARMYGEANQAAIDKVRGLVEALAIDCDFTSSQAYTYTERDDGVGDIEAESEAAARLGLPASFTTTTDLPYEVRAAVRFERQAHLDPYRYCLGLARAVDGDGSVVLEDTEAVDVDEQPDRAVVRTPRGEVECDQVVLATLLPFVDLGGFFAKAEPSRSYAMAVRIDGPVPQGMYLSADSPTRSLRPLTLASGNGLILGGASHPTGQDDDTPGFYEDLESWARQTFPVLSVDHRWSAQDYVPVDGVPYVGRSPRMTRTAVATGFKKWGITNGTAAAMLLADLLSERDNPWLEVFDATRIGDAATVKSLVAQNLEVGKRFVEDQVKRLALPRLDELPPGQGALVDIDGRAVAAYRDDRGDVHAVSPTCTHLACTVHWNAAELTWDCPCHGSRFTPAGEVIEGPAVRNLEPIEVTDSPS